MSISARAEILIATAGPLKGQYAALGEQLRQGASRAVADINAAGGINGEQLALEHLRLLFALAQPAASIDRIAETFKVWSEEEKFSRIVNKEEIVKNDYNISPSRYIHTAEGEEYRPLVEIVDDLKTLEAEIKKTNSTLEKILNTIGI